ncbi:MAG: hypothetical protein WBG02_03900 [Candidatus Acidiferrum sp.]
MTAEARTPAQRWEFVREHKWPIAAVSILLIVPCFWQRHIEAGDLASHVYNAWLGQLIERGQAPGLYFVPQWSNILVDWLLLHAANLVGFVAAEKLVVSLCVLVVFWGIFTLVRVVSGRPPWFFAPCVAMLTYGYSFNMGFLNFCLSLGLAAFSLALLWRGRGLERLLGVLLTPFILLAHPLGLIWIAGAGMYLVLWTKLPNWWKLAVPAAAVGVLYGIHWYLAHQTRFPVDWMHDPFYLMNGTDQLALYGRRYAELGWAALIFGVICVLVDVIVRRHDRTFWKSLRVPFEFYSVAIVAVALLPENLRPLISGGWIGLLASRLTMITAIFGLCLMGCLKPRKWHLAGFGTCAIVFFVFLYQDTARLNRMETEVEQLVKPLPYGTRVLSTIWAPLDSRISFVGHFVDRACIAHCFSYENYEPSSGQFHIRARPGSPVVSASDDDSEEMQAGDYEMQDEDLPAIEIYQCDEHDLTKLCIRNLVAGEKNGRLGYEPDPD